MSRFFPCALATLSLAVVLIFYKAADDIYRTISPQGCRMSWMSPSYILQSDFNNSWTQYAHRYSLWLYREVGWEPNQVHGLPVLFIPGNAGSSRQVRSIASSAARQYFSSPSVISGGFAGRDVKPLDFFAVEFNEDLSAFHGPTIDSQVAYTSQAITFILSLYPPNTSIIVLGHSMGGIVAISLLPSEDISAIITMSTPHTVPPARFDSRIDEIYARNMHILLHDPTPILSICGGATDTMIPSESCIFPSASEGIYRRTVFTSALEGAWTGVGHREMVWCHQVRWHVARAALELSPVIFNQDRAAVLDRWLRDGNLVPSIPSEAMELEDASMYEMLPEGIHLVLKSPHGSRTYLLPLPSSTDLSTKFVLYVSQGTILPVSPQNAHSLRASVYFCLPSSSSSSSAAAHSISCTTLNPTSLKLLPQPVPGMPFPVPEEGSGESDGIVLFEADMPALPKGINTAWISVKVEEADSNGWVVGAFDTDNAVKNMANFWDMVFGKVIVNLPKQSATLRSRIVMPNLLSNALVVYHLTPRRVELSSCTEPLLPPLLMHSSHHAETHYYPLEHSSSIHLHAHSSGPYISPALSMVPSGVNLTIYSSGADASHCVTSFEITVDWWATTGRLASRYLTTLMCWAVGITSMVLFHAWGQGERGRVPSVSGSLSALAKWTLPRLLISSYLVSFMPLPSDYYLGIQGEFVFSPVAPLLVFVASGLVCLSWGVLVILMWPLKRMGRLMNWRHTKGTGIHKSTFVSLCMILLLVFLVVPWQVAFVGCWIIHFHSCATYIRSPLPSPTSASPQVNAVPLLRREPESEGEEDAINAIESSSNNQVHSCINPIDVHHQNMHILLFLTWLLPLCAPVLAVWVRTLLTAGYTTPFNGDHNVLKVAPILILVDYTSRRSESIMRSEKIIPVRWGFLVVAAVAFLAGGRTVYHVYDFASLQIAVLVIFRVGRKYLY